ncbi:Ethanolamine kinase [Datura stramonium]|uniref:Ethanolamine kinase n=1 Tax=Datura stramonium TaxID=4076 RepID=A0ABS8UZV7_DATST|nr:Ethanolamine kinase [Datura stramonium]
MDDKSSLVTQEVRLCIKTLVAIIMNFEEDGIQGSYGIHPYLSLTCLCVSMCNLTGENVEKYSSISKPVLIFIQASIGFSSSRYIGLCTALDVVTSHVEFSSSFSDSSLMDSHWREKTITKGSRGLVPELYIWHAKYGGEYATSVNLPANIRAYTTSLLESHDRIIVQSSSWWKTFSGISVPKVSVREDDGKNENITVRLYGPNTNCVINREQDCRSFAMMVRDLAYRRLYCDKEKYYKLIVILYYGCDEIDF